MKGMNPRVLSSMLNSTRWVQRDFHSLGKRPEACQLLGERLNTLNRLIVFDLRASEVVKSKVHALSQAVAKPINSRDFARVQ